MAAAFPPRSVRAQRKRLNSAADFGKLVGVSGLTIYNWESGKSRAGETNLAALVAVRKLGKREASTKLEVLGAEGKKTNGTRRRKPRKGGSLLRTSRWRQSSRAFTPVSGEAGIRPGVTPGRGGGRHPHCPRCQPGSPGSCRPAAGAA